MPGSRCAGAGVEEPNSFSTLEIQMSIWCGGGLNNADVI